MDYRNKKVLVVGMARSGISAANLLCRLGAIVTINDSKDESQLKEAVKQLEYPFINRLGMPIDQVTDGQDLIVISPGVPYDAPALRRARSQGIRVIGEMELASTVNRSSIVAITGTNGKTTTTTLVGEILEKAGFTTYVAGNIGNPFSEVAICSEEQDFTALEVSSFQLESIEAFHPRISAILNITPDHLNRHGDMLGYINAKSRIFENQSDNDIVVLNYDNELVRELAKRVPCRIMYFSRLEQVSAGCCIIDGKITYIPFEGEMVTIGRPGEVRIPGPHNLENALAAATMTMACGVPASVVRYELAAFEGVEHRIEMVDTINGVRFINDSKGTNPDASIKAVQAMQSPTVIIAGGYDKGSDFSEFIQSFLDSSNIVAMIAIGDTQQKLVDCAARNGYDHVATANTFKDAVHRAFSIAKPGYNILLSPACASFDMFQDYEERGKVFKSIVAEIREKVTGYEKK